MWFILMKGMITIQIAIDGPAGAGKSTIARIIGEKLEFLYIDTGAMYRAITYLALTYNISCNDERALSKLAKESNLTLIRSSTGKQLVVCNNIDISEEIREPHISNNVSIVARHEGVRKELVKKQQTLAQKSDVIMDGRDIGTVVLPDAECKIYLTASLEERASRRYREMRAKGYQDSYEVIKEELEERDFIDKSRKVGPLKPACDAIVLDTTFLSQEQVVSAILEIYQQKKRRI